MKSTKYPSARLYSLQLPELGAGLLLFLSFVGMRALVFCVYSNLANCMLLIEYLPQLFQLDKEFFMFCLANQVAKHLGSTSLEGRWVTLIMHEVWQVA